MEDLVAGYLRHLFSECAGRGRGDSDGSGQGLFDEVSYLRSGDMGTGRGV